MTSPDLPDVRAGRVMRAIAVGGLATAVFALVIGWQFLTDLDRNLDRSLVIGEDAAATLTETIDVATEVVVALDDGLTTIDATLQGLTATTSDTADVASATAELATSLPASFDDVDAALATVESLSGTIDGALRTASRLPLGPDYDPAVPFPDAVAELRAAFVPLGDDLEQIAAELRSFAESSGAVGDDLAGVRADVARTQTALIESTALLDRYRVTAERAESLARTSREDVGGSIELARWTVLILAVLLAVSQYVPWWLGSRLTRSVDRAVWSDRPPGTDAPAVPDRACGEPPESSPSVVTR